jgi:hypothetical protein
MSTVCAASTIRTTVVVAGRRETDLAPGADPACILEALLSSNMA